MSRVELISPEGLRSDGRRSTELRNLYAATDLNSGADGSAFLSLGNTKVLCAVYGPKEPERRSTALHDRAILSVTISMASFAGAATTKRIRVDKRLLEMASAIKHCFEPVILLTQYPRSEIELFIQVLQADGGVLHAAINAACLALVDAGIPMIDYVTACTAGYVNNEALVDLNHIEESAEVPCVTLAVLPKTGKVVLCNLDCRINMDCLEEVLLLGKEACVSLAEMVDTAVRKGDSGTG